MKKLLALAAVLAAVAIPATASAAADHGYRSQLGHEKAMENAICAGAGAFGAIGEQSGGWHDLGINNGLNAQRRGAGHGRPTDRAQQLQSVRQPLNR